MLIETDNFKNSINIENFYIADELYKLSDLQKYNLLVQSLSMDDKQNIFNVSGINNKYIKQICLFVEEENRIPLDLEIIIKDKKGYEKQINMNKYKLKSYPEGELFYSGKFLNLLNLIDISGEVIKGDTVIFKSNTYKFKLAKVYIFGNSSGIDYIQLNGEKNIMDNLLIDDTWSITSLTPQLISRIVFNPIESFKAGDKIKARMAEGKGLIGKSKEFVDSIRMNKKLKQTKTSTTIPVKKLKTKPTKDTSLLSRGKTEYEILQEGFIDSNKVEGFTDPQLFNSSDILLELNILNVYYDKPILIMKDLTKFNINIPEGYSIAKIYGKAASTEDIQEFKVLHGLISFRDSLNPDIILNETAIIDKIDDSIEILDVLDYQKKINSQLKQLDLNKHNIRDLYNQKLDIMATIEKIDRISNNYLKLIQDADAHNAKKFTETIELLQYLKGELEKQSRLQKVNFDINLML